MSETADDRDWRLPEESPPLRLMATIWADLTGLHDDLGTAADVDAWLDAVGIDRSGEHAGAAELDLARRLREANRLVLEVRDDLRASEVVHDAAIANRVLGLNMQFQPMSPRRQAPGEPSRAFTCTTGQRDRAKAPLRARLCHREA